MKITTNNNTVNLLSKAKQSKAIIISLIIILNFYFKNKSIEKIIKILSVSFGYINRDNLSGEKKPDFVINKKFFIKGDNK